MTDCLVGLGSNLGDRRQILDAAIADLKNHREVQVQSVSDWITYPAVGGPDGQGDFLNGVARLQTSLKPSDLAELLMEVEAAAGRRRTQRWSARTLDCDLLLFGDQRIDTPTLQVPHPRMFTRRFVLEPAVQVAAEMLHPVVGWTMEKLFHHLENAAPYFAVIGSDPKLRDEIGKAMAESVGGKFILADPDWAPVEGLSDDLLSRMVEKSRMKLEADLLSAGPLVGNFWLGEPWITRPNLAKSVVNPKLNPKLLVVTDTSQSEFAKRLEAVDACWRVPTLFLSSDAEHAMQDAVGAISAMQ